MPDEKVACQFCGEEKDPRGIKRHEQACAQNPANTPETETPEALAEEVADQLGLDAASAAVQEAEEEAEIQIVVKPGVNSPKANAAEAADPNEMLLVTIHPAFPAAEAYCQRTGIEWYTTKRIPIPGVRGKVVERRIARSRVTATITRRDYEALQKTQKGCVRLGH